MLTLNIGPLALAMPHVLIIASLLLATLAGWQVGRRQGINPEKHLFRLLLVALFGARLAFVAMYWSHYSDRPLSVLDVRDGGFIAWVGALVALLLAARVLWTTPRLRRPLGTALGVGVLVWGAGTLALNGQERASRLPDLVLTEANGRSVNLQDYRGKPLVINLWATWCPPCRREMPVLLQAQEKYPDITFVFVNQGESPGEIQRFMQAQTLTLNNLLLDPHNDLGRLAGSMALPTTLFFDSQGRQVGNHLGELSHASLARALQKLQDRERQAN